MKIQCLLAALMLLCLTAGCVVAPPARGPLFDVSALPAPPSGEALVVVYREDHFAGEGVQMHVFADGRAVATLSNASFVHVFAKPGHYTFTVQFGEVDAVPAVLDIKAGETYYLRARIQNHFPGATQSFMDEIAPADAMPELTIARSMGDGYDIGK